MRSARFSIPVLSPVCFWKHVTHGRYCGEDTGLQTWHPELGISLRHTPPHPMTGTNVQRGEGPQPLIPFTGLLFICPLPISFVAQRKKT